jgi:hypothetical protein
MTECNPPCHYDNPNCPTCQTMKLIGEQVIRRTKLEALLARCKPILQGIVNLSDYPCEEHQSILDEIDALEDE